MIQILHILSDVVVCMCAHKRSKKCDQMSYIKFTPSDMRLR